MPEGNKIMTEREKLIEYLYYLKDKQDQDELTGKSYEDYIADFILADRLRIVEPLVELNLKPGTAIEVSMENTNNILTAIMQAMRLSGVEND